MKLTSIAIDDEPPGLHILADDLRKIPTVDLIGTFTKPFDALELIQQGRVDLLFLDIQMPTLLGTDFLRALTNPPMVIFTTAYEQYAIESYDLNVVDYLLKPIRFERLLRACTKAYQLYQQTTKPDADVPTFFFVKTDYKDTKIYHHDILYVEGLKDYVKIYLESQPDKPILTRLNVKAMEAKLESAGRFCRVHQSFIVPLRRITGVNKTQILLDGTIPIPVGERYVEGFQERYRAGA
ncbi:LytR/AlgR family response regulator transcription factor [Fibrella aquatilis]|uniref:Response regulator transcription factor n=1 Tax=Fibrella aquatilis TaxID=2817059 RepID=A0A939G7A2_9BACT|nr:LytTR family DNA-binding domain-containing protein [Fibrella aquatilis]MBO0931949.1 response regulator transcription factor [Fibrella aquatilis]